MQSYTKPKFVFCAGCGRSCSQKFCYGCSVIALAAVNPFRPLPQPREARGRE